MCCLIYTSNHIFICHFFFIILIYSGDDSSDDEDDDDDANNGSSLYCQKESSPFHGSSSQPSPHSLPLHPSSFVVRAIHVAVATKQSQTQRKGNKSSTNKSSGDKHSSSTATQRSKGNDKTVLSPEYHGSSRNKKIRECTTIHTQAKSTIQGKIMVSEGLFQARDTPESSALYYCRLVMGEGIHTNADGYCIQWEDETKARVKTEVRYVLKSQICTIAGQPVNWDSNGHPQTAFIPDPWQKKNVQSVADVTELTEDEQMKLALEKSMDESQNVKKAAE